MAADPLKVAGTVVWCLQDALARVEGLTNVPGLLRQVLKKRMWCERIDEVTHRLETFTRFEDFITTHPPRGLGFTVQVVRDVIRHDSEVSTDFETALAQDASQGGDHGNQYTGGKLDNIQAATPAPTGTSKAAGIRKLAKHAPDALERVKRGEVTVNKALTEAGLRRKRTALEILMKAWRVASPEERAEFMRAVTTKAQ